MNTSLHISGTTATLTFDRQCSDSNILDLETLDELSSHLDELSLHPEINALVIRSAKPGSFIEDFDPADLLNATGTSIARLISTTQNILNRIANLPIPSIAAIHGSCLGAGYELALACDWRVASDSEITKIGLPQTEIGLIPASGGTTRLPNLLGLQDALPIILSGKIFPASNAKENGLIDETVPSEHLETFSHTYISKGQRILSQNPITRNQAVAKLIQLQTQKDLLKSSHPLNPAPAAALDAAVSSVGRGRSQSQLAELETFSQLIALPQTAQLIRFQSLKQAAKNPTTSLIRRATVIGADHIGIELAFCLSSHSIHTQLLDASDQSLASAISFISSFYSAAIHRKNLTDLQAARGLDQIHLSSPQIPLQRSEIIIASIPGHLEDAATRTRSDTIIACQQTAEPIHPLASSIPHPERLIGLHFFHPAHQTEIVEIIRTILTSEQTIEKTISFIKHIKKIPIVVKDSPGFLVNRILTPYLLKAVELFQQGGDPNEIDKSMLKFGMKTGPLRLIDEFGLDQTLHIARTILEAFPNHFEIPEILSKLIALGHSGIKDGSGFYVYDTPVPAVNAEAIGLQTDTEPIPPDTAGILSKLISQEAKLCLNQGIAQTADDIDLACILAAGYPPSLGGPITHAKTF